MFNELNIIKKNIEMIKSKELLPLTGYVHGGCSPIGMKKVFTTVVDETAILFDNIIFSGGKIGYQIEMNINYLYSSSAVEFIKNTLIHELAHFLANKLR